MHWLLAPLFFECFPCKKSFSGLFTRWTREAKPQELGFFWREIKKQKCIIIRCKNNQLHLELGTLGCARITATSCLPRLFLCFVFYLRRYNVLRLFSFTKPPCPHTPSRWSIPGKLIKVLADPMHCFFFYCFSEGRVKVTLSFKRILLSICPPMIGPSGPGGNVFIRIHLWCGYCGSW